MDGAYDFLCGTLTVGVTAQQLPNTQCIGVIIENAELHSNNTDIIYVGKSDVDTTGKGFALHSGDQLEMQFQGNANTVWVVASGSGKKASYYIMK